MSERILLAVDESPASERSVEYVSAMLAPERTDVFVHLVHIVPLTAPHAEGPPGWKRVDADKWEMLGTLRQRLVASGIQRDNVEVSVLSVVSKSALVEGLLEVAREERCGTIVVGRNSLPWFRELFHGHAADELVKKGTGFTLWIVE